MAVQTQATDSPSLLIILATLVALGPLTIDTYLPALPGMVRWFDTSISQVQLTISSYLVGFAIFHLVCGPLADRFGRRPVLLGGLAIFSLSGFACAQATAIEQLIVFRFLQGVGACVGPTLGRAVVRDIYGPRHAARALAYIAMIMALAPAVAPTLGGLLLQYQQWPAIFYALIGYGVFLMGLVFWRLPESLPERQSLGPRTIGRNYWTLLRSRHFMTTTCASSCIYAGMISFLSGSSFVFVDMMQVPTRYFGLLFLPTVAGYMAGNGISTRLGRGRGAGQVMEIGASITLLAAILMFVAPHIWFRPAGIILPMSLYSAGLGITLPHAMAAALRPFPHMAGTASAFMGFLQMGLSSLGGALVGLLLVDSATPMTAVILAASCAALFLIRRLNRRLQHPDVAY